MSSFTSTLIGRTPELIDQECEKLFRKLIPNQTREYRSNRCRIYFKVPEGHTALGNFGTHLFESFSRAFEQDDASVIVDNKTHCGDPVLKFTGDTPGPNVHHDYVARIWYDSSKGFAAQTLKRNFEDEGDSLIRTMMSVAAFTAKFSPSSAIAVHQLLKIAGGLLGGSPVLAAMRQALVREVITFRFSGDKSEFTDQLTNFIVELSKRHFLAGRRSWVIDKATAVAGDGNAPSGEDVYFLETAAIERVARAEFLPGAGYFDSKTKIIWPTLLRSYVSKSGFELIEHETWPGSHYEGGASWISNHYTTSGACRASTGNTRTLHNHLLP